jgi:hypothetical protein
VLHGFAGSVGQGGDGLGSLAPQVAEFAPDDDLGEGALLVAVEAGEVAGQEGVQPVAASADIGGGDFGIGEEGLRRGVLQESGQGNPLTALRSDYPGTGRAARKKGYSRTMRRSRSTAIFPRTR